MSDSQHNLELARAVLRQGELMLDAQLRLTIAAMQRATTMAAILTPAAVAALALAMNRFPVDADFAAGLAASGATLVVGAGFCVSAIWPARFRVPGNTPRNWWEDGVEERPLAECLRRESENYDDDIKSNRALLARDARRLRLGAWSGCAAPVIGLAVWAGAAAWATA